MLTINNTFSRRDIAFTSDFCNNHSHPVSPESMYLTSLRPRPTRPRVPYLMSSSPSSRVPKSQVPTHASRCPHPLDPVPLLYTANLQRIQNAAGRLVTGMSRFSHVTPLYWMPVQERIRHKIIILSLKSIYGLASTYLCSLITIQRPSMYSLRRSDYLYLKPFNAKTSKILGDRSFTVMAPSLFKGLPRHIRHEKNFTYFKSLKKTFLFKLAYDF